MIERPSSQKYMNGVPYAAQSQYKELPNENQSINGVIPLDTCPAGWWNGLWNFVTEQEIKITDDMDVIIKEIVAVIERAGIIDITAQNTLSQAIVTLAQTIATSNIPGAVISSSDDGAVAVDNTGKMTLNGYNDLVSGLGDIADLDTTTKSSVVSAINEIIGLKGQPNGVATLDENGRIPYSQLPESAVEYKGEWNASTNTPALVDGTGTNGSMYYVSVGGTQNLGSGSITFLEGDRIIYNGEDEVWQKLSGGTVKSVNSVSPDATGNVQLSFSGFEDVLPISKGGTGATTAKSAQYNLLNGMRLESNFTDEHEIVGHYATDFGNTTNGSVYKLKATTVWNWIKGKISSVLGLTASNYTGTSAKSTADGSGNNIADTYATKTELTEKVNATNIKPKTTTAFTYYALNYGDSITDYKTEGLLIQIRRLNFVPDTYLFNLSNYSSITETSKKYAITKLNASPKRNGNYDTFFYLDSENSTLYLKVASFSLLTMIDLNFRGTKVPYTVVESIPVTATELTPITYTTKDELESTYGLTTTQYNGATKLENATGVLPISKGGTGATTAKEAEFNLLQLSESTNGITDNDLIVQKYITPSASTGVILYKKAGLLWNYIKDKISSVLGLTASNYTGNANTAKNLKVNMLADGTDLNTITDVGYYTSGDNYTAINAPYVGMKNYGLEVIRLMGAYLFQRLTKYDDGQTYVRTYVWDNNSSTQRAWTAWKTLAFTNDTVLNATTANTSTYVVDSNQKLLDWANNVAGKDYSSVLIKKGTWTSTKGVNLSTCGTKVVVGEVGSLLSFEGSIDGFKGLFYEEVPTSSEYYMLNVKVKVSASVSSTDTISCFRKCTNLTNCSGSGTSNITVNTPNSGSGFRECTNLTNCSGSGTSINTSSSKSTGIGFLECTNLTNCSGSGSGTSASSSSSSSAGYGFLGCNGVSKCKALKQCSTSVFYLSYASQSDNSTYTCADTPEGGFNDTTNPSS